MTSPTQVLKSGIGPKLVPFFKTVAVYFVVLIPSDQPSFFSAILKALPVLSLLAFVLLHGMSFGDEYLYSRRILLGLMCSVVGDVLLVWEHLFLHGLAVFLVAQIFYISAFGFNPLNLQAAAVIYGTMAAGLAILVPNVQGVLQVGVVVYTIILMTMVWRAIARVQLFEELWTWTKLCSCAGGILFAFSDGCIGFHHFYSPIPHSQVLIMTTYYAAQLFISLSVVDCKASYLDSLKNKNSSTLAATTADDADSVASAHCDEVSGRSYDTAEVLYPDCNGQCYDAELFNVQQTAAKHSSVSSLAVKESSDERLVAPDVASGKFGDTTATFVAESQLCDAVCCIDGDAPCTVDCVQQLC